MPRGVIATMGIALLLLAAAPSSGYAGELGRKVADSGPQFGGSAAATATIHGSKRVFFKATRSPAEPFTGTVSINCFTPGEQTVYHHDYGLPGIETGFLIKEINLPRRKRFRYCVVNPLIQFIEDASGEFRVQVFVRPRRHHG